MQSSATNVERSINLLIEHQCPQCGAPAILEETDRLFTCDFCRVKSYLMPQDIFRYTLPNKAPEDKQLIYLPYWRIKGILFSYLMDGIGNRYMDMSHQAVKSDIFPVSVGLRSQALKLKFASANDKGHYLKPSFPRKRAIDIFTHRLSVDLPTPVLEQHYIGETSSLIYSPFYIGERIYDAVLNKPLNWEIPEDVDPLKMPGGDPDWKINFLPTLCPNCGWDMEGEKDSLALSCRNCNKLWQPDKTGFTQLNFGKIPNTDDNIVYLPFWRIKAKISGIRLNTYADLVKQANLPKVVQKEWDKIDFRFWVMGFKVRPQKFLQIATHMTLAHPREKLVSELPKRQMLPVTFPLKEAVSSLKLILTNFVKPQKSILPRLEEITVIPKSYILVYVPFLDKQHEFIQPDYQLAIIKNHLALARNL